MDSILNIFNGISSLWEAFVEAWDKVSTDALFSAGIAIFVFTAGWIISFLYDKRKESKRLKQRIRFLKGSLESMLHAMSKQASYYKKMSDDLKDLKKRHFSLKTNSNLSLAFYSPQLIEDSHRFLEQYEPRSFDVMKTLSGAINGIEVQLENAKANHLNFSKNANKNEEEWVNATDEIFRFSDDLKTRIENTGGDEAFLMGFNEIISKWYLEKDDLDTEKTYENLIKPLKEYCIEALPHQDARVVLPHIRRANYSYENIVSNRKLYSKVFSNHAKRLNRFIERIEKVLKIFEENLTKFRWITKHVNKSESKIHLLDNPKSVNDHPINVAAKEHLERLNMATDPKSFHIYNLLHALISVHGVDYSHDDETLINDTVQNNLHKTDPDGMEFLISEYNDELIQQISEEISELEDEVELKDYLIDDLLVPAINNRYDKALIKQVD
ncbi:hypothetical protein [Gracilimonas sediminicola]|uniref:hypothetical protein n=1 Tax=Gracilimonas sediminicola TaxID=2952158 RepID=UPI0038D50E10